MNEVPVEAAMSTADFLIGIIVVIWCVLSWKRGFVREAISLASWIAAFIVARVFSTPFALLLADYVDPASIREPVAFGLLFIATLGVCALLSRVLGELIDVTGLTVVDRLLGMVFGGLKALVMCIFVFGTLARVMDVEQDEWWKQSLLIPHLMLVEEWTRDMANQLWQAILAIK